VTGKSLYRLVAAPAAFLFLLSLVNLACNIGGNRPYHETFDSRGSWGTGSDGDAEGDVTNGRYELLVKAEQGIFWSTGNQNLDDGMYEVEATQLEGTLDNGYGMLFRVNNDTDSFYLLEVSGDGFVWIGRCADGCAEVESFVQGGWFESETVNQGHNATNHLRVRAEGANMTFFVNNQEIGRMTDDTLRRGDIGIFVETLGEGGVRVAFDNFKVTPLEE
jgi:hypothetical protein